MAHLLLLLGAFLAVAAVSTTPARSLEPVSGPAVYQLRCAVCHGTAGEGQPGDGIEAGPPLRGLPVAYVDLVLRTGRMPIEYEKRGVIEKRLTDEQRRALVAWADLALDLRGVLPEVGRGEPALGQQVYQRYCAACHGATGGGGVTGDGTIAPPVTGVDRTAVVEALRVGPFEMPEFGDTAITDEEADAVAAYTVEVLSARQGTPLGLVEVSPVQAGALAAVVVALVLAATVLVARLGRTARTREETR